MQLLLCLIASVLAQNTTAPSTPSSLPCDIPTYVGCITANDQFKTATCTPLTNATLVAQCQCYASVDRLNCFVPACVAQNSTIAANAAAAQCSAVGLNPNALPQPAPWCTQGTSCAVPVVPTATNKPAAAPTATGTTVAAKANSGARIVGSGLVLISLLVLF